ncbi:MAG TPA: hypothetical protein VFX27_04835, partial [Sphingobium sp.]|nr:hypothetical protein [Sphingobium sp.]
HLQQSATIYPCFVVFHGHAPFRTNGDRGSQQGIKKAALTDSLMHPRGGIIALGFHPQRIANLRSAPRWTKPEYQSEHHRPDALSLSRFAGDHKHLFCSAQKVRLPNFPPDRQ